MTQKPKRGKRRKHGTEPKRFKRVVEKEENNYFALGISYATLYLCGFISLYPYSKLVYYGFLVVGLLLFPITSYIFTERKVRYIEVKDDE